MTTALKRAKRTLKAGKSSRPEVSTRTAILQTLSASGPLRARDIVQAVAERNDVPLHGKTPRKSVEARLAEMTRRGELVNVDRGVYRMNKRSRSARERVLA